MTTAHEHLALHLSKHKYERGEFKGDAPADHTRRGKSHFRVARDCDDYVVVFHNTNIITARPDGSYKLHTSGWDESPTTRDAMSLALGLIGVRGYMRTVTRGAFRQTALRLFHPGQTREFRYYDGMEFSADHALLTPPQPFTRRQVDRDRTKEFREAVKLFRGALPLLHAACPPHTTFASRAPTPDELAAVKRMGIGNWHRFDPRELRIAMQTPELWPLVVRQFRCETHEQTWAYLYRVAITGLTKETQEPL
jgi:hypothetical protein